MIPEVPTKKCCIEEQRPIDWIPLAIVLGAWGVLALALSVAWIVWR